MVLKKEFLGETEEYVYDISLDGTFVNALGFNMLSNTDGINFKLADTFRYTEENPYISNGKGRNSVEGKAYTGLSADVREFEDLYMFGKNGIDIDEIVPASINFRRKNYADLLEDGKIKLVGNTIKSKKMPLYIEKFLDKGIRYLLEGKGYEFIEYYYDYIEKIYNFRIPLKEIASVGKIKMSLDSYKKECSKLTKSGTKKARQAWYELAIKDKLDVNMGDAIYYINVGSSKLSSDIKRETKYYIYETVGGKKTKRDITKELEKEYKKYNNKEVRITDFGSGVFGKVYEEDVLNFNCIRLPNEVVEDEDDKYCDSDFEYNVEKYINMFNKRISPLFVCFDPKIRYRTSENGTVVSNIMITNPDDRKSFTREECVLTSGFPDDEKDQDDYDDVMELEDKEVRFWRSVNKKPPYIDECNIEWK